MTKGRHIGSVIMLIVVFVLLCTVTRADASCTPSELESATCLSAGGYDIRIVSGPNGEFPVSNNPGFCNGAANCFTYTMTQNTSKNIAILDLLIPVCSSTNNIDNSIVALSGYPSGWHTSAPGAGGWTTNWAWGVFQEYVLEYSFNSDSTFWLTTTPAVAAKTSMAFKIGNSLYAGAILGPSCYQPQIATTTMEKIQLNPNDPNAYIIVTMRTDGSVVSVVDNTGTPLTWHPLSDLSVNGQPITYLPNGTVMKTGTNSCYSYVYLGRACTKCY